MGAVGKSGSINQITLIFNGYETKTIETELKSNYPVIYRGDDHVLIYDEKDRLKTKIDLDVEGVELEQGANNLRVSADFNNDVELKIEAYVRLKDKVEKITVK